MLAGSDSVGHTFAAGLEASPDEEAVEKSELIWMNGELVPWDDANVHVLSHGLHYGTGVFEGIRGYETDGGTAVFRHREHLERLAQLGRALLPAAAVLRRGAPRGDARADPPQRACELLHPADRLPRLRRDGPVRAERAVDVDRRRLAVGRLPRRGGQAQRHPRARSPRGGGISAGRPDPAREGLRPVPELDPGQDRVGQRRLRRGDPARRPAAWSARARARTSSSSATA